MGDTRNRIIENLTLIESIFDKDGNEITVAQLLSTAGLSQAAFVANADETSLITLAASVDALRDSLIAAGLMASS